VPNPYARIFSEPGAKGFSAAAFIGRLPLAMAPIGIVAMLSQTLGAYWLAGAVAATYGIGNAFLAPQISRLVDRYGQTRVAAPATVVSALGFLLMVLASHLAWPAWTLFASALGAATLPSMSAMVRARWSELFRDRPELNTAFAFESSADELLYISGASLSVAQRGTEPPVRAPQAHGPTGSAIRLRAVQIVTLALIFVGAIFATAEVGAIAITKELGQPGAASLVIGVYAVGSFVLGLVLGALNPRLALHRQLLIALGVLALTTLPLLVAGSSVALLATAVFLSGVAISPTFITAFGLIERRVPASMLTEGVTWVMTGIGIGMALGAFVAGWVVDTFGAQNGFWVSVVASGAAVLTVALGQRTLAGERAVGAAQPATVLSR
jgi:MFS family permease